MSDDRIHSRYTWTPPVRYVLNVPPDNAQMSLDDFDLDTEHIPGAVSADTCEADLQREEFYERFRQDVEALTPITCMPDYGVHVYARDAVTCTCGKGKGKSKEKK